MRKNLWILDLVLLGLVFFTGTLARDRWQQARQREEALLQQMVRVAPAPALPALPAVTPSTPAAYMEVAQNFVFSRDRNPNVILDPPPPPPPPPAAKPMPALPLAYGVMNLGNGPMIILAPTRGAQHRAYKPGERIGEFKLIGLNSRDVTFEWEGKQISRKIEELVDKQPVQNESSASAAAAPKPQQQPQQLTSLVKAEAAPGVQLSESSRACVPGDTSPAGTVKDGFRKVVRKTPFGDSCRWEAGN